METKPDTIKISASHKDEIFATHADLHVTVKGASIVSGAEAMKKAKEVSQLVEALTSFGIKRRCGHVAGSPHRNGEWRVVEIIQCSVSSEDSL
jgi:uncharacterized protein YggE